MAYDGLGNVLEATAGELETVMLYGQLHETNTNWIVGDGMWSWGNAYLYESGAWPILEGYHRYDFGSGSTAWYILDAETVRKVCIYNTNLAARCKKEGE